ncbi:hypothetical protein MLD38_040013 [Melastoma candidum]|uniref:Uncharacterized protein n=1 Tax=Melastoma candidum TaxID=119954 RepID=A0ACB9L4C8_9MYRT|nr:hypothetical protein MLD38_040013 [Melastoma candidum]
MKRNGMRSATSKAWDVLRLALRWARKGRMFRRRILGDLHALPWLLRSINRPANQDLLFYGERELSFEKTPVVRVRMHRPLCVGFPCINLRPNSFDHDFGRDSPDYHERLGNVAGEEEGEGWVDARAEEFIARFYEQMRLQRQISHLEYDTDASMGTCG